MLRRTPLRSSGVTDLIDRWNPTRFKQTAVAMAAGSLGLLAFGHYATGVTALALTSAFTYRGYKDLQQSKHTLLKNFPVLAHLRYILEGIRPEIRQYFIEDDQAQVPFSREQRALVYARAKGDDASQPFGTRLDYYKEGREYLLHSMFPKSKIKVADARVMIGEGQCSKPYSASILNTSAMSFGALSANAIRSFGKGAKLGNYYQNTGEGGLAPYHLEGGNDVVLNLGTAYFGLRTPDGRFDEKQFVEKIANNDQIKMIEIKLSQGAKPGKGGVLPGAKITPEIAAIRGVPMGKDCVSPAAHAEFSSPEGLIDFAARLRKLSGGKPVGIKLCVGDPIELAAIIRASVDKKSYLDFITVDCASGGTGAAPKEFSDVVGEPLTNGLYYVHNMLRGAGIREHTKVIASGKIVSGFSLFRALHLGADICNSARGFMFSIGCIQALQCHSDHCPTGITTHNPIRTAGLDPTLKSVRAANYQRTTVESCLDLVAACGFSTLAEIRNKPVLMMRTSSNDAHFSSELYPKLKDKELLSISKPTERLQAAIANMTIKDRLVRAWLISGNPELQPKIKMYMQATPAETKSDVKK